MVLLTLVSHLFSVSYVSGFRRLAFAITANDASSLIICLTSMKPPRIRRMTIWDMTTGFLSSQHSPRSRSLKNACGSKQCSNRSREFVHAQCHRDVGVVESHYHQIEHPLLLRLRVKYSEADRLSSKLSASEGRQCVLHLRFAACRAATLSRDLEGITP